MKINKYILSMAIILSITAFTLKEGETVESITQKEYKNTIGSSTIDTLLVNNNNKLDSDYKPKEFKVPQIPFIDGATNEERWFVEVTKEAIWLAENAHRFGFILRYEKGKEAITGKSYEPWHVRYVGKEIAKDIFEQRITLEEYIENK